MLCLCMMMYIIVVSFVLVYTCGICMYVLMIFLHVYMSVMCYMHISVCVTMHAYVYLSHYSIVMKTHYDQGNLYKKTLNRGLVS